MSKPPPDPASSPEVPKVAPDKTTQTGKTTPPDTSAYQAYKEEAPTAAAPSGTSPEVSPMELASKEALSTTPTFETLTTQAKNAQDTLGDVEKNLKTPNLKFKKSQSELLQNKLGNANDHLDSAVQKMGGSVPEETQLPSDADPVTRFLGMVTDGQNKIAQAHDQLQSLSAKSGALQPADMLLIQIKLAQAQQEIEYSSVLLSKVVDSLKQIINIQM
jgi:hypothetical protein